MVRNNRFFQTLFDFSFSRFITTKIIGLIYAIALLIIACIMLVIVVNSFRIGFFNNSSFDCSNLYHVGSYRIRIFNCGN